jgi:ADP-ribose pyrophosphatase YjhB (NUDIX family)
LRELREEAGLIGEAPRLISIYHNARTSKRDHVALYRVERFRATVPAWKPNAEIVEIGFFSPDALPDGTTSATRRRIAEVLQGKDPTEVW